ncbi:hypothetical protein JOE49_002411 [Paenibacillus sp. PvR133]|uniref:hypothetical protein n=1 Tax=unclassified Paenibacillus TaxID=185978 RepID=UPI0013EA47E1|nr:MULTISPECIES: hypothetical protein [unclassified Paenibacillus]KAF6581620.1 hypothetical protein G9G54_04830 [Paenibacillus sp. EKM212P]MBP1175159.1 hypothetical protein [Paenibacillus sp. PvR133]
MLVRVFLKRWYSIFLYFVSLVFISIYIFKGICGMNYPPNSRDTIELISWLFSGVVSIISFLSIFVGFVYDNKLINASSSLKQIYKPYGLEYENYQATLIDYQQYVSKGLTLNSIYWVILVTSNLSIIIWLISLEIVNNIFPISFNFNNITNIFLFIMWLIFSFLLTFLVFYLNRIKNNKDPLGKGYLPKPNQLLDMNFLVTQDVDMDEIIQKALPIVELYSNPEPQNNYEMNLVFPLPISNYKYVIKIYDINKRLLLRCFGYYELQSSFGKRQHITVINNMSDSIYNLIDENASAEIKVYSAFNNSLLGRMSLSFRVTASKKNSQTERSISHLIARDIDQGLITTINNSFHSCQVENGF